MSHSPPTRNAIEPQLLDPGLVDLPQRWIRSHGLQGVCIDVGPAIDARSSVLLEQAEPDEAVDSRTAHTLAGGRVVDRHQFGQVGQILAVQVTSSLQCCVMTTTKLSQCEYVSASP